MAKTLQRQRKNARKDKQVTVCFPLELWADVTKAARLRKLPVSSWLKQAVAFAADEVNKGSGQVKR